jgi:hypothetical protein
MNKHADSTSQAFFSTRSGRLCAAAALAAMSFASFGCVEAVGEEDFGSEQEPPLSPAALNLNGITSNAITSNAITSNAITSNAITSNAITSNAITSNALLAGALTDPAARELLKYVVSCALPAGAAVEVTVEDVDYVFPGQIGLAPEWGEPDGSCGPDCRKWVSACVLSRVNYLGVPTMISMRGKHFALEASQSEQLAYPRGEAAYWGDIFAQPQTLRACLFPGKSEIPRVCGPSIRDCFVDVVGDCDEVCDEAVADGSYQGCDDADENGENAPVTVFLQ